MKYSILPFARDSEQVTTFTIRQISTYSVHLQSMGQGQDIRYRTNARPFVTSTLKRSTPCATVFKERTATYRRVSGDGPGLPKASELRKYFENSLLRIIRQFNTVENRARAKRYLLGDVFFANSTGDYWLSIARKSDGRCVAT